MPLRNILLAIIRGPEMERHNEALREQLSREHDAREEARIAAAQKREP